MQCPSYPSVTALTTEQPIFSQNVVAADAPACARPREPAELLALEPARLQRALVLGGLCGMFVHEMNNILTSVLGRADMALHTGQVPDLRRALEHTCSQVHHAIAVIKRLRSMTEPREGPVESCELASAVQQALELVVRPLEKDRIALRVSVPAGLSVTAPRELLVQVLLNLILNARQAMKDGGHGRLTISARPENGQVLIEISDTGHGIAAQRLKDVINPFLAGAGLDIDWMSVGLGLHMCRCVARSCGAAAEAAGNADGGCTFRLHWPGGMTS